MIRWEETSEGGDLASECGTFEVYWHGGLCAWCARVVRGSTWAWVEIGCRETVEEAQALASEWLTDAIERAMLEELR